MTPWASAWHGIGWPCVRDGRSSPTLAALVEAPLCFDPLGIAEAWGMRPATGERTVVAGVSRCRPEIAAPMLGPAFDDAFASAVATIAAHARAPALALGGGLDGAAVLAAWCELSLPKPTVLTLATGLGADYDEVEPARAIAAAFGVAIEVVHAQPELLVDLVAPAVLAADTPFYNLHPVARLALARAAAARGHDVLVTGDGADAAYRGRPDLDYVPIVAALTESAGLTLRSPFVDDAVLASITASPDKQPLRRWLAHHGAPRWLVDRPKHPRSMPALDLEALAIDEVPSEAPPAPIGDRGRVGRTTLAILAAALRRSAR